MSDRRIIPPTDDPIVKFSASEMARRIRLGELSSVEVYEAHVRRIEQVNPLLNAIVVPTFEQARRDAEAADTAVKSGAPLGPLHGVPFTVKECFHVKGTQSTIGVSSLVGKLDKESSPLVKRLQAAGGVLLGKTNVPQLMVWHECDNPVYGRTNLPMDLDRSPGGSTGGEAAAIAAFCSPLGIGNDLGGSVRLPATWCGLFGLKPTSYRITNVGTTGCFRGQTAMITQPGPLARTTEDVSLAFRLLVGDMSDRDVAPVALRDPADVSLRGMRIVAWDDDGYYPSCVSHRRAVHEVADALSKLGVEIVWIKPPGVAEHLDLFYEIMGSDGGDEGRRFSRGSKIDYRVSRMMWMAAMPLLVRYAVAGGLRLAGQKWIPKVLMAARGRPTSEFWMLCERLGKFIFDFSDEVFLRLGADAILSPAHALPALKHEAALDLLPAASYSFLMNLLALPSGVVPWTTVSSSETVAKVTARDLSEQQAQRSLIGAEGMPVGVQLSAAPWREDVVLQLMQTLEQLSPACSNQRKQA